MKSTKSLNDRIAYLSRRIKKIGNDFDSAVPISDEQIDGNLASDLLARLEGRIADSLLDGLLLKKVPAMSTYEVTEVRDAVGSLWDLLNDLVQGEEEEIKTLSPNFAPEADLVRYAKSGRKFAR